MNPNGPFTAETLSYIFSLVCQPPRFQVDSRSLATYTPPLRLGAVCRCWRSLAWRTPSLWSQIYLKVISTRQNAQLDLLKDWLIRTQGPLNIVLRVAGDRDELKRFKFNATQSKTYVEPLLEVLVRESGRWRSVELDLTSENYAKMVTNISLSAPILEQVRIRTMYNENGVDFYQGITSITHLFLEPAASRRFIFAVPEASNKITNLYLDNIPGEQFIQFLATSCNSNLRHLRIESFTEDSFDIDEHEPIDFPHLETLVMHDEGMECEMGLSTIFPMFKSAPKLRKLGLDSSQEDFFSHLQDFLTNSNISLEVLRLCLRAGALGVAEELRGVLRSQSESLVDFWCILEDGCQLVDEFTEAFHVPEEGQNSGSGFPFLPKLEHYGFLGPPEDDATCGSTSCHIYVAQMVKSWWTAAAAETTFRRPALKKLRLHDLDKEEAIEMLKEQLEDGLEVVFEDHKENYLRSSLLNVDWHLN